MLIRYFYDEKLAHASYLVGCEKKNQAKSLMEAEDKAVLDVRGQTEYEKGHIEGAVHIMVGTLKDRLAEVPDKKLIVHCQAGKRSAIAVSILKANGFHNLVNIKGGYARWQEDVE